MTPTKNIFLLLLFSVLVMGSVVYLSCSKDNCKTVTCKNGGTCSAGICNCPTGWIGANCEKSAFIGNWSGNTACDSSTAILSLSIAASSTDTGKYIIQNPAGYSSFVTGTSNGPTSITISSQNCASVTLSGTITLSDNKSLSFVYTATDTVSGVNKHTRHCTGTYKLQ